MQDMQDQMQDEKAKKAAEKAAKKAVDKGNPNKTPEEIAAEKNHKVEPEKSDGKMEGTAEPGCPPKTAEEAIGKAAFDEDKFLTCHLRVADLAEMVHESVRANIFKDSKPWIQLTDQNRMDVILLVRNLLNHRQPSASVTQSLVNKILTPQDAKPLHQLAPHEQRLAHMIYGIVMGFKKVE